MTSSGSLPSWTLCVSTTVTMGIGPHCVHFEGCTLIYSSSDLLYDVAHVFVLGS